MNACTLRHKQLYEQEAKNSDMQANAETAANLSPFYPNKVIFFPRMIHKVKGSGKRQKDRVACQKSLVFSVPASLLEIAATIYHLSPRSQNTTC